MVYIKIKVYTCYRLHKTSLLIIPTIYVPIFMQGGHTETLIRVIRTSKNQEVLNSWNEFLNTLIHVNKLYTCA